MREAGRTCCLECMRTLPRRPRRGGTAEEGRKSERAAVCSSAVQRSGLKRKE